MAESKLLLGYWSIRGLGQPIRNLLEYLQIPYEDKRYSDSTEWFQKDKLQLKTDFPNLPYLVDGDKVITESYAIQEYIALKSGKNQLLGENLDEKIHLAQLRGVIQDIKKAFYEAMANKALTDLQKPFTEKTLPRLAVLSKHLGENEFLIGRLTILDFVFSEFIAVLLLQDGDWLSSLPNLKSLYERVNNLPGLKEYNSSGKAPQTYQGVGMMNAAFKIQK